ncbi:MAG: DNA double-strand break repair nuclease NurA, partial [Chloroflexota bacterium]
YSAFRKMKEKGALVAGYISYPHATEVVNLLRLLLCPHSPPDCDQHCRGLGNKRLCQAVGGIEDRELFACLLQVGERSPLFSSRSSVVVNHYGEHQVCFFYLRGQEEVVRIEVPRWLATDTGRLDLVHSLVFDQCRRGGGYPVALMEAHEQAVLSPADRESFWNLIQESLAQGGIYSSSSAKRRSKQVPWV